jgi:hypothetical protein
VAHLICNVVHCISPQSYLCSSSSSEPQYHVPGHLLLFCKISIAFVKKDYWNGSVFAPVIASRHTGNPADSLMSVANSIVESADIAEGLVQETAVNMPNLQSSSGRKASRVRRRSSTDLETYQPSQPPFLSFLGSQRFAAVIPITTTLEATTSLEEDQADPGPKTTE